jgi:hypothetical protein
VIEPPVLIESAADGETVTVPADVADASVVTPEISAVPLAVVALKPCDVAVGVNVTENVPSIVVAVVALAAPIYAMS